MSVNNQSTAILHQYTKESLQPALVEWLYDLHKGWYVVQELREGKFYDLRVLKRVEALAWRNPNPKVYALSLRHFQDWRCVM